MWGNLVIGVTMLVDGFIDWLDRFFNPSEEIEDYGYEEYEDGEGEGVEGSEVGAEGGDDAP